MPSTPARRVISLLPGATEMVAALGATDRLIGRSHECDWPPEVQSLPCVTITPIDVQASSRAIDAQVRAIAASGEAVIGLDVAQLEALHPDLIITQVLCEVCAVSDGAATRIADALPDPPRVLSLHGTTLEGMFADIHRVADALGVPERAAALVTQLRTELDALSRRFARPDPPTVMVIEWLDPCFLAGHWTPELVAAAGGRDIGMRPGQHSVARDWGEIMACDPDVAMIALCGFDEARARKEFTALQQPAVHAWLAQRRVVFLDGNAYTSRAGPRVVEAVRVLGERLKD